ncbi:ATP/GTP-binding protein [Paenibacillus xylanexedens]|uniref:AAA family ATPase n=1 Tax=Paenibacillus xylanexedens TaxID=528191 RepID=UPI0011A782F1|nr:ATP-binding protein [Paenibacillus xylanexedens]
MLSKITMSNFRSFKNTTVVDIRATGYKILSDKNVYADTLKGLFFVGANASGKTNAIRALKLLLDLLFAERKIDIGAERCLFSSGKSMSLEYEFEISHHEIKYYIEYIREQRTLVEVLTVAGEVVLNRIGKNAKSEITENKVYEDIDTDMLVLREIYFNTKFRTQKVLKDWFDFLINSVYIDGYKETVFSPGNINLTIEDYLENHGVDEINTFFEKFNFNQRIEYANSSSGNFTKLRLNLLEKVVYFKREGVGEPIPFSLESLGNQKLLRFLPAFFHSVKNGGMLIVDEFSSGLHNFLEELLIRYFMNGSKNSQLFIVSHSTNLLSNSLLRPDQIYAVDFNGDEGSLLKRFSSEQPRVAQNLEKMYTSGVFGGIPAYKDDIF